MLSCSLKKISANVGERTCVPKSQIPSVNSIPMVEVLVLEIEFC